LESVEGEDNKQLLDLTKDDNKLLESPIKDEEKLLDLTKDDKNNVFSPSKEEENFLTTLKEEEKTLIINNITNVSPGGSSRKRPLEHIASNDNLNEMDGNLKKLYQDL